MEKQKVEMFMAQHGEKFPAEKLPMIQQKLEELGDDKFMVLSSTSFKDPTTLLIISIVIGSYGVDRFMLGQTGLGVLKLLTVGACGIWTIIDWFQIKKMTREVNYAKFSSIAG